MYCTQMKTAISRRLSSLKAVRKPLFSGAIQNVYVIGEHFGTLLEKTLIR